MNSVTKIAIQTDFILKIASLLISLSRSASAATPTNPSTSTGLETLQSPALKINDKIPDFQVDAYYKGNITKINTADYRDKLMVVGFYPADFAFVCPKELEEVAAYNNNFTDLGAEFFSVSRDSAYVHKVWHNSTPQLQTNQ